MSTRCYEAFLAASGRNLLISSASPLSPDMPATQAPSVVQAVPVLYEHLSALSTLFAGDTPSLRLVRASSSMEVCYFFGDASGEGFGSSWWQPSSGAIRYRFGIWGREGVDTSSNYRELRNLVDSLEEMGVGGELDGKAIFVFTDNMVSETVAAKGSSASKPLFDLVVRLFRLEMSCICSIEVVHVAGTRMIAQGTDGLSRGDMYEGIMRGESMLSFVPLHRSAVDRHPPLAPWIHSWSRALGPDPEFLEATGWFERGHDVEGSCRNCDGLWMPSYRFGTFIWTPPPAAGRIAIEELRQARHKRQQSTHVFVCPRLLWTEWRRHLFKSADLICKIPCGTPMWPAEMHEPLTLAIYLPYLRRCPWELRKSQPMVELERSLRSVFKTDPSLGGDILSKILHSTKRMDTMSLRELRKVLSGRRGLSF